MFNRTITSFRVPPIEKNLSQFGDFNLFFFRRMKHFVVIRRNSDRQRKSWSIRILEFQRHMISTTLRNCKIYDIFLSLYKAKNIYTGPITGCWCFYVMMSRMNEFTIRIKHRGMLKSIVRNFFFFQLQKNQQLTRNCLLDNAI